MLRPEEIKFLIIHCSDTPNTDNFGAFEIHKMHISFGWDGIGYHKVINRDGLIENGRPEYWQGAHTYGRNHESIGICLIGKDKFTLKQFNSLKITLKKLLLKYPKAKIRGHSEVIKTDKTCPNFDVQKWVKNNL